MEARGKPPRASFVCAKLPDGLGLPDLYLRLAQAVFEGAASVVLPLAAGTKFEVAATCLALVIENPGALYKNQREVKVDLRA
jgi:hypothetical protein